MGRRPNQLVFEFFERGRKLEDASNRYEHTCKRCHELFPKGRVDGLINHLLRRCPHVTLEDREVVLQYVQQNPERSKARANPTEATTSTSQHTQQLSEGPQASSISGTAAKVARHKREEFQPSYHTTQTTLRPTGQQPPGSLPTALHLQENDSQPAVTDSEVPFHLFEQQQQSALDTLAEVSRRHLDFASQRFYAEQEEVQTHYDPGRALAEQALMAQLQAATAHSYFEPQGHTDATEGSQRETVNSGSGEPTVALVPAAFDRRNPVTSPQSQAVQLNGTSTLDPQLGVIDTSEDTATHPRSEGLPASSDDLKNDVNNMMSGQMPTAVDDADDYSLLQTVMNHRSRARFSAVRRKEVQETRKRGACIRCRMLKKSCSDGTPCKACKSVETARLWKTKCLRTRLADEFSLWSTGFFYSEAQAEDSGVIKDSMKLMLPGRVEVRLISSSDQCMTLAAKQFSCSEHSEQAVEAIPRQVSGLDSSSILSLNEGHNMPDKLEEYIQQAAGAYIEEENSIFLRATLQQAQVLVHEAAIAEPKAKGQSGRVCYNLQNQLLSDVIKLWAGTRLLVAPHNIDLQLRYSYSMDSEKDASTAQWDAQADLPGVPIVPAAQSHQRIKSQLLSVVESRCSKLSKSVMNELERRLLQRRQVSRFATFLSAIILLNCVERLTGFYRAFNYDGPEPDSNDMLAAERVKYTPTTTSQLSWGTTRYPDADKVPQDWPQKESAGTLWEQGEHFADLLIMLLRMRALPPKTAWTVEGRLVVTEGHTPSAIASVQSGQGRDDEQVHATAAWLDPLELNVEELNARSSAPCPPRSAGVAAWDMHFISRVLLPESLQGTAAWH